MATLSTAFFLFFNLRQQLFTNCTCAAFKAFICTEKALVGKSNATCILLIDFLYALNTERERKCKSFSNAF